MENPIRMDNLGVPHISKPPHRSFLWGDRQLITIKGCKDGPSFNSNLMTIKMGFQSYNHSYVVVNIVLIFVGRPLSKALPMMPVPMPAHASSQPKSGPLNVTQK